MVEARARRTFAEGSDLARRRSLAVSSGNDSGM